MEKIDYQKLYLKLTKGLSQRTKDIFDRRFGIKSGMAETLESIGKELSVTRERIRQIEEAGLNFVKKNNKEALGKIFRDFSHYFEVNGGFKKEDIALADLGGVNDKLYVLFIFSVLGDKLFRVCGRKDYHYFWSVALDSEKKVKETLSYLVQDFKKQGKLLDKNELFKNFVPKYNLNEQSLKSYIEVSKNIKENKEGKFGLIIWPEIEPRGVRDKAFLVFKKEKKPLHFREITELIDKFNYDNLSAKKAHPQTVHNELIKDSRFVLVGRGIYALKNWGYKSGTIKDIITQILQKNQNGALQEDIVKEVLSQRLVARNTVLINLNNKKHFNKDSEGKYSLRNTNTI